MTKTTNFTLLGAILLVGGCSIGAGMLGLPVISAQAGFLPSTLLFFLTWFFMALSAVLLLEVNLSFKEEVSIPTMAERTLGKGGKVVTLFLFAFLFYSLMVAYIAGSGQLIKDFLEELFKWNVPEWGGSLFVTIFFAFLIYRGTFSVDLFNRILMTGLILTYILLISTGLPHVNVQFLKYQNWHKAPFLMPIMVISFGYHNLIPTLKTYLKGRKKSLLLTIFIGSALPLAIYLIWEAFILALVPVEENLSSLLAAVNKGEMATRLLRRAVGHTWIKNAAEYFAFFALLTSLLTIALSFLDFLADSFHMKKDRGGKVFLSLLTLAPPFIFALLYPEIFLKALNYAGAFGAVILFGTLPSLMVWSLRYRKKVDRAPLLPGGKVTLFMVILFSLTIVGLELIHEIMGI